MSKELYVRKEDNTKRVIYLVKELLKDGKDLNVVSSHLGAEIVSKVCNALANMNYVTIDNVQTKTEVRNEKRKVSLAIHVTKTSEFDKLYDENQLKRKEMQEKRDLEKKPVTNA